MGDDKMPELAFPAMTPEHGGYSSGMTMRDWFAGQALYGLLAGNHEVISNGQPSKTAMALSYSAYWFADAMLEARK